MVQQLSKQDHYDYGLRAVKSVLVMAGGLKRSNPDTPEELVLIRALRDSNVPKFLADDLPLFAAIVQDLFPGVEIPSNDYGELQVALEEEIVKDKDKVFFENQFVPFPFVYLTYIAAFILPIIGFIVYRKELNNKYSTM